MAARRQSALAIRRLLWLSVVLQNDLRKVGKVFLFVIGPWHPAAREEPSTDWMPFNIDKRRLLHRSFL
jgi:hypothetical protein